MAHVGHLTTSKSKPLADRIDRSSVFVGVLWWVACMALAKQWLPLGILLFACVASALAALYMARCLQQRLQGFTGDGLGATQQLSEMAFYLGLVLAAYNP